MRVLVVEDDKMCQTAISNMAKKMTFLELAFANDGKEAVQKASEIEFSLILMDMYMPEMTGIDATKIIRESTINKNSVIVSLSGDEKTLDEMKYFGFDDVVTKPINRKKFEEIIKKYS